MDTDAHAAEINRLTERLAPFNHYEMVRVTPEQVEALKRAVGWAGDEDFYSRHPDDPAKAAARVFFRHWNSATSVEREAQAHARSEAVRGPAISRSNVGA